MTDRPAPGVQYQGYWTDSERPPPFLVKHQPGGPRPIGGGDARDPHAAVALGTSLCRLKLARRGWWSRGSASGSKRRRYESGS